MKALKEALEKANILKDPRDITLLESGCDDATVALTPGKIILWFGRQAGESLIREIIFGIASVDPSVNHEQELICDFKSIPEYENMGYILTSYARTKGGYRVVLNIPFSKRSALSHFVRSIASQLREKDLKKILHWNGSIDRMNMIYMKLTKIERWEIKRIECRDNEEKVVK